HPVGGAEPRRRTRGQETVLVVEDDPQVRSLAAALLGEHGYTVLEASNGHDAWTLTGTHTGAIDLLVTDVVMPRMSGRDLAERLSTTHPEMPVLYMSGYTDSAIAHHGVLDSDH